MRSKAHIDCIFSPENQLIRLLRAVRPPDNIGKRKLTVEGYGEFEFPLDAFSAYCLTRGIDQLDFILENEEAIAAYEEAHAPRS